MSTGEDEVIVLPLGGRCDVRADDERFALAGRASVFEAVSDFAYVPRDAELEIESASGGRFALASARAHAAAARPPRAPRPTCRSSCAARARPAARSTTSALRETLDADRLIAVEVLTPGGNWSSYPPHKHDEEIPGVETALEEIYYFEVARGGFAYQRAYGGGIDICREVRTRRCACCCRAATTARRWRRRATTCTT